VKFAGKVKIVFTPNVYEWRNTEGLSDRFIELCLTLPYTVLNRLSQRCSIKMFKPTSA